MKSKLVMCLATAVLLLSAGAGSAGSINFTLGGETHAIDSFVFNTSSLVSLNNTNVTVGSDVQAFYQSTVSAAQLNGLNVNYPALNSSDYITIVAGVTERVLTATVDANGNASVTLGLSPSDQTGDYIKLYDVTSAPNPLAGTGYNNTGTLILSATATAISSSFAENINPANATNTPFVTGVATSNGYSATNAAPSSNTNPNPGTGATTVNASVNYVNPAYFSTGIPGSSILFTLFNGTQTDQFRTVSPTKQFVTDNQGTVLPNIGTINGISGPDELFQVDASQSFITGVPEPSSITLAILGAGGFALARIRRRRQTTL